MSEAQGASNSHARLKLEAAAATRLLVHEDILDYSGHVSVRVPGRDAYLIQRGVDPRSDVQPERMLMVDFDGNVLEGEGRAPIETLFNEGVGDIFPARVAGNSALPGMVGTLEYAVEVLKVPLIMVMGHENCGAVSAAKTVIENGTALPGELGPMVAPIIPAAVQAMKAGGNDVVNNAVRLHAQLTARWLRSENRIIAGAIGTGALKVVASYYDIDSGSVTILPD